ncbi:MAG: hypothetical protein WCK49_04190 [Myxococcaceae bacterium]
MFYLPGVNPCYLALLFLFSLPLYCESVSVIAEIPTGFHILKEAPVKIKTMPSNQFQILSFSQKGNTWTSSLKAFQPGTHRLEGVVEFFICDNKQPCKATKHSFSEKFNAK